MYDYKSKRYNRLVECGIIFKVVIFWCKTIVIKRSGKMGNNTTSRLCKIVYFDEDSVTDYIQIMMGGILEKTTELLSESSNKGSAGAEAKAGVGLSGVFKALIGFEASANTNASLETSFNTNEMAKNIVKNTILTDFIDIIGEDSKENKGAIKKFRGYQVSAYKDSLSYVALISPYLSMLKGGSGVPAGDFNIAVEKLDNTMKSAKGYFEFIGEKDSKKVIFRFNIKSFKNNYKVTDLLKMDVSIFAIKVGTSSLDKLDIYNELDVDASITSVKDNPNYQKNNTLEQLESTKTNQLLDVYDVLLTGVELDD